MTMRCGINQRSWPRASGSTSTSQSRFLSEDLLDALRHALVRGIPVAHHHERRHDGAPGKNEPARERGDVGNERSSAHRKNPECRDRGLDGLKCHGRTVRRSARRRCSEVHTRNDRVRSPAPVQHVHADDQVARNSAEEVAGGLVSEDDAEEGVVDPQLAVVFNEPELAELVHEEIDPRARCPNHLGQCLL